MHVHTAQAAVPAPLGQHIKLCLVFCLLSQIECLPLLYLAIFFTKEKIPCNPDLDSPLAVSTGLDREDRRRDEHVS